MAPPKSALADKGSVMRRKTANGEAPSTPAACSSSRSIAAEAPIAVLKNGDATKTRANTTAICVKTISTPELSDRKPYFARIACPSLVKISSMNTLATSACFQAVSRAIG